MWSIFYSSVMRVNLFWIVCLLLAEESHTFWGICVIDMKIKFENYWVWERYPSQHSVEPGESWMP